jgi:hypothetical protein
MCRLSKHNYINDLLLRCNHPKPCKPQHSPHAHSAPLNDKGIKCIQGIIRSLLYCAQAVDNKFLATLSTINSQQANATENTAKAVNQLLDYVATYPAGGITYRASSMVLAAHSDASFLTEMSSRSQAGAHIFLSKDDPIPQSVLTISRSRACHTLHHSL